MSAIGQLAIHDIRCDHIERNEGPRVRMRYGSSPTQVCLTCKAWRTMLHVPGRWQHGPVETDDTDT